MTLFEVNINNNFFKYDRIRAFVFFLLLSHKNVRISPKNDLISCY